MSKFMNEKYCRLEAYTPGEQPQDKKYIKLNTNESPYPPSQGVLDAVNTDAVSLLNLYPDPECKNLRRTIAEQYTVEEKNVFVGNGSDDILNFAFMAFCGKDSPAAFPDISYGFYKVYAELHAIPFTEIPLNGKLEVCVRDYIGINKNIFIANPNAPTGLTLSLDDISRICESNKNNIVVIDEAYVDFGAESSVNLTKKFDNLITVMTYSKSRSMAGARLGFAIANEEIIKDLEKIKYSTNPYSINRLTNLAGIAALKDNSYYVENCKKIIEAREYTKVELQKLGFELTDSKSNFIFTKNSNIDGEMLYKKLKEKGILVRHFSKDRIKDYVRITVGTKEQMDALLAAIKTVI
ncbi:MAG: histidinol-phosphate transaminase [Clostridia bacterium]|nr:histidinol-phosphate transaminase [Clostridia bacterium]